MAFPTTPGTPGPSSAGAPNQARSGKATGALVCGILSIPFGIFLAIVGLVLGIVAIVLGVLANKENRAAGVRDGKATGGVVTGAIGTVISIAVIAFFGYVFSQYGDDIKACSQETTDAARQACIEERVNQD